jgi:hypothetical protein
VLEVAIDGPIRTLQIMLKGLDQGIESAIKNRTMVHVDQRMATRSVIARAQAAVVTTFQRDYGAIAISQCHRSNKEWLQHSILELEMTDALQG